MRIYMGSPKSEILGRGGATVRSGDILYLKSSQICVVRDDEVGAEGLESSAPGFGVNLRSKEPRALNRTIEPFL